MSTSEVIKPKTGEKPYRMSDGTLRDPKDNSELENTSGNIVNFKVEYPKDFKGVKHMKDGDTHKLHTIHAELLAEKGYGKIQK